MAATAARTASEWQNDSPPPTLALYGHSPAHSAGGGGGGGQQTGGSAQPRQFLRASSSFGSALSALSSGLSHAASLPLPSSASHSQLPLHSSSRLRRARLFCTTLPLRWSKWLQQCQRRHRRGQSLWQALTRSNTPASGSRTHACQVPLLLLCSLLALSALLALIVYATVSVSRVLPKPPPVVDFPSLPAPMPHASLFELHDSGELSGLGYDGFGLPSVEFEEEAYHRLLRARRCAVTDLLCSAQLLPLSPLPRSTSALSPAASPSAPPGLYRLAYVLLCNAAFVDMALNLLCSADAVSVARSAWLIVAADRLTFRFFTLRGFNVVLLEQTRLSEGEAAAADDTADMDSPMDEQQLDADGQSDSERASSWQSRQHIDINREKIPLLHSLLSHGVDVLLFDADLVVLHSPDTLFPLEPASAFADLTVMSDYPYSVLGDLYSQPELLSCVGAGPQSSSPPCSYLWELNGGFFLLRASSATVRLLEDMWDWLRQRPNHNDQDALRAAVREKFHRRQLRFVTDSGTAWPPHTNAYTATATAQQQPLDHRLSVHYLPPLLAPNGGLFFLDGQQSYREEASKADVYEPAVVHLNWIVGYQRKLSIARAAGLWFVVGARGQGRCSTLRSLSSRAEQLGGGGGSGARQQQAGTAADLIAHRNTSYLRLSPSTLDSASLHSLHSSLSSAERSPGPTAPSLSARRWDGSSSPLFLLFASPKPLSSFLSLPAYRAADSDGLGEQRGAANLSSAELAALKADNALQVEAQLVVMRSWFGLSDGQLNLCQVLLFSNDEPHVRLADSLSFDLLTRFDVDAYGAPKLHSLFRQAEYVAGRRDIPYLLYVNGDIALGIDAAETADAIAAYDFPELLAVGSRPDVNTQLLRTAPAHYTAEMEQLRAATRAETTAAPAGVNTAGASLSRALTDSMFSSLSAKSRSSGSVEALDFFLFSRGLWDWQQVPRFLLGRVGFDNWLLHWANSRKSATVVDCSPTLTALHMSHDLHSSSTQPGGMTNLRLAGQPSRRGLGSLQHVAFRTARLGNGDIRVVRQRPDSGHLKSLYDAAEDGHITVRHRPTLFVVTVDAAFLPVFQNWLLTWRVARGNDASGLLLLSTHPVVTEYARAQTIAAFELAQGDKAVSALNGEPTSYLQVMSLRSKAILFLLEFGYDVLNLHVDSLWIRDPLALIQQHARIRRGGTHSDSDGDSDITLHANAAAASVEDGPEMTRLARAVDDSASAPTSPASDAAWLGEGVDLVAFTYPSSAVECASSAWNVSVGGLLLRHSPESLRMWRRVSAEYGALVSRATMAHQLNLLYLDEDWYVHFELRENTQLAYATVCTQPAEHVWRAKSFGEYRQGALVNATEVARRQRRQGMWLLEPDVHDAFYRSDRAPATPPLRRLQHFPALSSGASQHSAHYAPLTPSELDMIRSVATPDSRAVSVLSLHADSCESAAVQKWLSRARQLSVQHILLLADSSAVPQRCSSSHSPMASFPVLYPPPAPYSASTQPHLTYRVAQLLEAGFVVTLVDVHSVWFSQPLQLLADELQSSHYSHSHSLLPGDANRTAPALYACDVLGHTQRNGSLERGFVTLGPSPSSSSLVALVHDCLAQQHSDGQSEQAEAEAEADPTLPWSCLLHASVQLQRVGLLSVCQVDVDHFPSAYRLFESGDALDSGVWPVVSPARYVHPRSGRVKEFVDGWERFNTLPAITPPGLQQRSDDDSRRAANSADYSICPPSALDASLRPHFTLLIKVLTFTRADSLERLLRSLAAADYGDDRVHLDISIDKPAQPAEAAARFGGNASSSRYESEVKAQLRVVDVSSKFEWAHGSKQWRVLDSHSGLVGQWLGAWLPAAHDDSTFVLVLEDDMEVSGVYYAWLKALLCRYYFDPQQFDPHLYGISLQNQRHVVGRNKKLQQAVQAESRRRRSQQQTANNADSTAGSGDSASSSQALNASLSLSAAALSVDVSSVVDMRGKLSGSSVYRYQLVGTWGLLLFPQHWRAFVQWYRDKSAQSSFTPCVPFLDSSVWWARRPASVWSQWLIRYTFERGWYCAYSHWDDSEAALAINHRERGENYKSAQGADNSRLVASLGGSDSGGGSGNSSSGWSSAQFGQRLPRLSATPLFDFYFDRVHSNGESLSQRHLLLNARHWRQACREQYSQSSAQQSGHTEADAT